MVCQAAAAAIALRHALVSNRPEIVGEVPIAEVIIRHGKVTLLTPIGAPRVTNQKALPGVVVTHTDYGVATQNLFALSWQIKNTRFRHRRRFERSINSETEDKRETLGQTGSHLVGRCNPMIGSNLVLLRRRVTRASRFFFERGDVIRPLLFWTHALFRERLDSVSNKGATILIYCSFDCSLVVVDKQPTEINKLLAILYLKKLKCANQGIRGAAPEISLIFNRRTFVSEINSWRQRRSFRRNCRIGEISMVG